MSTKRENISLQYYFFSNCGFKSACEEYVELNIKFNNINVFLISNFRRFMNVVCFLVGDSPASDFICRRFGTLCLFHLHRQVGAHLPAYEDGTYGVPKRRHLKSRRRGVTQKKAYNNINVLLK